MLFDNVDLLDLKKEAVLEEVNCRLQSVKLSQNAQPMKRGIGIEWLFARDETEPFRSAVLGHPLEAKNAIVKLLAIAPGRVTLPHQVPPGGYLIQALRNSVLIESCENRRRIAAERIDEGGISIIGIRSGKIELRLRAYGNWSLIALVGYLCFVRQGQGIIKFYGQF